MQEFHWKGTILILGFAMLLLGTLSRTSDAQANDIRTHDWLQSNTVHFESGQMAGVILSNLAGGELRLASGATSGVYTSPVIAAPFTFNAAAPHWRAVVPAGSAIEIEMRVFTTGEGWSPWHLFDEIDSSHPQGQYYPEIPLLLPGGTRYQYRATLTAPPGARTPILDEMTVTIIDTSAGPTTSQAKAASPPGGVAIQDVPPPAIITRAGWNADETLRYDGEGQLLWVLEYEPVTKIVLHHTVSSNDYGPDDGASLVRAIYYYHAVTRGWGDIGYNYLIDKYGNIYEGRYGGPGVVGGHVYSYNYGSMGIGTIGTHGNTGDSLPPTAESLTSIADLAAWEANRSYIHPLESAPFYDAAPPNLAGHRDFPPGTTSCPGDYLYAELPELRSETWERIITHTHQYHTGWLSWSTPPHTLLAGETYSPSLSVRNSGWLTWPQAGISNAVRLGYHWLDGDSLPLSQPPSADHRGPLDYDLTFGHNYDFQPAQFTTPITPGTYTLAWDMVHEGVDWFNDANPASPLLTMTLTITGTPPVRIGGQFLDLYKRPINNAKVALPNWITVTGAANGDYTLPPLARIAYTLTTSAQGYTSQLPAHIDAPKEGDVTYPFIFIPDRFVNLIANSDFENGLTDWNWDRDATAPNRPISTTTAHTGLGAAQLGGSTFSGTVWLSQTVNLPAKALSPTLSLLYRVPFSGESEPGRIAIINDTASITHTLPLTATHWTHFQTALPDGWAGYLDLRISLAGNGSITPTTLLIDEVLLGYQGIEPYLIHLPLLLKGYAPSSCTEQIGNGDFESTANWEILSTAYPASYSTAQAHGGFRAMRVGIEPGGENTYSYSSIQQTFTIPAKTAGAILDYWWYPAAGDPNDLQYLLLMDAKGALLDSLLWTNANDRTWLNAQADLTEYAGLTLTLRFGVYNDGSAGLTRMYVDDVSLQTCPPP